MKRAGMWSVVPAFLAAGLATGLATGAYAQKSVATPPRPERSTAARPSTLTFEVEVTDQAGHPVTGLQGSDFTVFDNIQPAAIQTFAAHTAASPNSAQSAIVVIDAVNTSFVGTSLAEHQLQSFLQKQSEPLPFPIGIVLLRDTGLTPLGPYSSNGKVLLAQLRKQSGQLRQLNRSGGLWGAEERMNISLNAMGTLARLLTATPGRKLLIWISPGWATFDNPGLIPNSRQEHALLSAAVNLSEEMEEGRATVYDVDPLGTWDAASYRTFLWQDFTKPLRGWTQAQPGDLALQVLAVQSGGLVLNSSNDVAGEVKTCAQDGSAWYTITIARQASEKPDTWRTVEVKLDKPGLRVRTRDGYYAQP
jgi:VWFA-related protein